jgi:hypothetical protein
MTKACLFGPADDQLGFADFDEPEQIRILRIPDHLGVDLFGPS